jgi:Family of unknown function (DUF5677)
MKGHDRWKAELLASVRKALPKGSAAKERRLSGTLPSLVNARREALVLLEQNLATMWAHPLFLLEAILALSHEAGDFVGSFLTWRRERGDPENPCAETLLLIHARAARTTSEILALLSTGHADGANARWRTLHEITVTMLFLFEHGRAGDLVERYLLHERMESWRGAREFQAHRQRLGYRGIQTKNLRLWQAEFTRLKSKYGAAFEESYGWARGALAAAGYKGKPTFALLEKAVEEDFMRPYYRMASHGVHAGPKGATWSLGLIERGEVLLAGPSTAGLAEPGQCAARSMGLCTTVLLRLGPFNPTTAAMDALVQILAAEAPAAFVKVEKKLERQERRKRRRPKGTSASKPPQ